MVRSLRVIDWRFDESPYYTELDYTPGGNLSDWCLTQGGVGRVPLAERLRKVEIKILRQVQSGEDLAALLRYDELLEYKLATGGLPQMRFLRK